MRGQARNEGIRGVAGLGNRGSGRRLRASLACMAAALVVAGCGGPNDLKVINRTQVPILVTVWDSRVAVGACSERTVGIAGNVLSLDNGGHPLADPAPPGAVAVPIPATDITKGGAEGGMPTQVLVITDDYIGVPPWNGYREVHVAGSGTLPPDPGSVECTGSPPPQSSPLSSSTHGKSAHDRPYRADGL